MGKNIRGYKMDVTKRAVDNILGNKPAKRYPKPKYMKCNKGHTLVEVYDKRQHAYVWDCPTCIRKMGLEAYYEV